MAENYKKMALQIAEEVAAIAKKDGLRSAFSIETTVTGTETMWNVNVFFPLIRRAPGAVIGVVKVFKGEEARDIAAIIDGKVDYIFVDVEKKVAGLDDIEKIVKSMVSKSKVFTTKLNDATVDAADVFISQLAGTLKGKRVALIGAGNNGSKVALRLAERGAEVVITRTDIKEAEAIANAFNIIKNNATGRIIAEKDNRAAAKNADILICFAPRKPIITAEIVNALKPNAIILDGGIGTISPDGINAANWMHMQIFRLDMRTGFAGAVTTMLETEKFIKETIGKTKIADVTVVAGGFIGEKGDVIIDSISKPTRVIGIADGSGGVLKEPSSELIKQMERVRQSINKNKEEQGNSV